jgi:hypothetical protein
MKNVRKKYILHLIISFLKKCFYIRSMYVYKCNHGMECHGGKFERIITQRTNGNWSQGELVSGRDPRIPPLGLFTWRITPPSQMS